MTHLAARILFSLLAFMGAMALTSVACRSGSKLDSFIDSIAPFVFWSIIAMVFVTIWTESFGGV